MSVNAVCLQPGAAMPSSRRTQAADRLHQPKRRNRRRVKCARGIRFSWRNCLSNADLNRPLETRAAACDRGDVMLMPAIARPDRIAQHMRRNNVDSRGHRNQPPVMIARG